MNGKADFAQLAAVLLALSGFSLAAHAADPLFMSDFESTTTLNAPQGCGSAWCYQTIGGHEGNFIWPVPGTAGAYGDGTLWFMMAGVPVTSSSIDDYTFNRIVNVRRYSGGWNNKALFSQITEGPNGQNPIGTASTQNDFSLYPTQEPGDFYMSYWIRFQPGMTKNMVGLDNTTPGVYPDGGTWRAFFALKTGTLAFTSPYPGHPGDDGDYRIEVAIATGCHPAWVAADIPPCQDEIAPFDGLPDVVPTSPFWVVYADSVAGGAYAAVNSWTETNSAADADYVPVPDDGSWKKVEVFLHRSSSPTDDQGRFWLAFDNKVIVDHIGRNRGAMSMPVNRIMPSMLYTGGYLPIYQWIDNFQVWTAFPPQLQAGPCAAAYWCNYPYAPH